MPLTPISRSARRILAVVAVAALPAGFVAQEVPQGPPNADFAPAFAEQTRAPAMAATPVTVETFAPGLENPWGIAPLPEGRWLVTERPGRMRVVAADGTLGAPLAGLPEVYADGQGGLLDVATAPGPDGATEVWWTYAKSLDGGFVTAAARGILSADATALTEVRDVFIQSPPSPFNMHYGSRVVIDGDHVFITTGEHFAVPDRVKAQDLSTTYGKVIRLMRDGSMPPDNPFGAEAPQVWSLGHRNIQGATLDAAGTLWTIEHGPQGGDELNRPEPGLNYGWPVVSYGQNYNGSPVGGGDARAPGFEEPVYYWDPVIAPGGMAFYDGDLFDWQGDLLIGSLNPGALVRLRLDDGIVVGEERPITDRGRVRDVEVAPDGSVLILVDSPDGAILRVTPG